jgi:hypothetical protein
VITRSLKSLWQSDVLLGACVGAATSGLLVVLALVVAPMLDGASKQLAPAARSGTANLPAPARPAQPRSADDDSDVKRDRASVTRRNDTSSLPSPIGDDKPRRKAEAPDKQAAPIPLSPSTTINKVPVVPALAVPTADAPSAGAAPSITPASPRTGLRLRVRAASFGREGGEPELRLTMGISGQTASTSLPEQVTVRLRPDVPAHPEDEATPLALNADVDVVDGPQAQAASQAQATSQVEAESQGDSAPAAMGLRVRMSLVPATGDVATVDEEAQGDGNSNVVKVAVPLTAFNAPDETSIPGVPTELPTDTPTDGAPAEPAPSQPAPSEPAPSEPAPSEPAPSEPAPSKPAPSEPEPSPPAPSEPAPSQPAPPAPEPSTITVQEIHVPLLITLEPVTTVEDATLPLPSDVPADTLPPEGMRVTISVQNALNEVEAVDPPATADPGAPAPDASTTPATEPGGTEPPPADGHALAASVAEPEGPADYGPGSSE